MQENELVITEAAAKRLGVSIRHTQRLCADRKLEAILKRGVWYIKLRSLENYITSQKEKRK